LRFIIFFSLLFSFIKTSHSEEKPLYEIGLIGSYFYLPHYRGSNEYEHKVLPLPYFVYRGKFLKSKEGKLRVGLNHHKWSYGLSFYVVPPMNKDTYSRRGMNELGAVLEVGPSLTYQWKKEANYECYHSIKSRVSTALPDLRARYAGIQVELSTGVKYQLSRKQKLQFNLTGLWSNNKKNDYFYSVNQDDVLNDRPAYDSNHGYGGVALDAIYTKEINSKQKIISFIRLDNTSGAVFEDSPLLKEKNNISFGVLYIYKLFKSKRTSSK